MADAHALKERILFGLRVCRGRGRGAVIRGGFRRGRRATSRVRGAAGDECKSNNGKAGEDKFFHDFFGWFD